MTDTIYTYDVDGLNRVRVEYDEYTECPATWYGARVLDLRTGEAVAGDCDDLESVVSAVRRYDYDEADRWGVEPLRAHCARRGEAVRVVTASCWRGTYLVACDERYADEAARMVDAWLDGEVYRYALERLDRAITAAGDVMEKWEECDAIGGVYDPADSTLEAHALEWATADACGYEPPRYELITSHGAPQCGREAIRFADLEALEYYVDNARGVADELRDGYASIREIA